MQPNRREFFRKSVLGIAAGGVAYSAGCAPAVVQKSGGINRLKLGVASYSFRAFDLEKTIEMTNRLGVGFLALKSMHMPLDATEEGVKSSAAQVRASGLNLYGAGVIYMKSEQEVEKAFQYATWAELDTIVGVPAHELLPLVESKVRDYDIKVAIHNHGPGDDLYPTPESVIDKIVGLDERIGLCIDIGHTLRSGVSPAESIKLYADRLHDVHIKDVDQATKEGKTVEIGRGVIDIVAVLQALLTIQYEGVASLEYEKDKEDPLAGAAESIGFVKGLLTVI
jgi:inosose dehydratase